MPKVGNRKVINRIADNTRKSGKGRSVVTIMAIILTTLLFTSVFTVGGSILTKLQEETFRQVGGSSHAGYKYLTQAEYDVIKADKKLKEVSCRISVGSAVNDALNKLYTEVSYYEDINARRCFSYPQEGRMPQAEKEIVTSDLVLEALGIPCEIGVSVPLVLEIGQERIEEEFVLSGYFAGDSVSMAQTILVSKEYQEKVAPVKTNSVAQRGVMTDEDYVGRIMADIMFPTQFDIEKQLNELTMRCGFPANIATGVNWAYMSADMDLGTSIFFVVLLLVIMFSGYLIIYNIFYINVYSDIRHYGLLKTIGTTGEQLKSIVRRQAYMLSAIGIPIGMLLGAGVGTLLLPMVMSQISISNVIHTKPEFNVWIFAGAALFSFATVYISCVKPCRIASNVTPIEALRMVEVFSQKEESRKCKEKATQKVTPRQLAIQNLRRNRKKVVVVIASLSLAMVLLNSIVGILKGFDMDKFTSNLIVSDLAVTHATTDNVSVTMKNRSTDGVTKEFLEALKAQEGIESISNIYFADRSFQNSPFSDSEWKLLRERLFENPQVEKYITENKLPYMEMSYEEYVDWMDEHHCLDGNVYGIGELAFEKLKVMEGKLDWEQFRTGNYIIVYPFLKDDEPITPFFYPGEKVTLYNDAGEKKEYEVIATAKLPYACEWQVYSTYNCNFILEEKEFLSFLGKRQPMRTLVDVSEEQEAVLENWIANYCDTINRELDYTSKGKIEEEFEEMSQTFLLVGGLLVTVLAIIGILNFLNTMITSILSRKQELAMLEAVGMSGTQQKQMLVFEGIYYGVIAIVVSLILCIVLNITMVKGIMADLFFTTWHFTVWPIIICIPLILIIVIVVPLICYQKMCQTSIIERIRRFE